MPHFVYKQNTTLEKLARAEKQPKKKLELVQKMNEIKNKLEENNNEQTKNAHT